MLLADNGAWKKLPARIGDRVTAANQPGADGHSSINSLPRRDLIHPEASICGGYLLCREVLREEKMSELIEVTLDRQIAQVVLNRPAAYNAFETQIEKERAALEACADHPDGLEGLAAFSEKRKPQYGVH